MLTRLRSLFRPSADATEPYSTGNADADALLRDKQQELEALMQAVAEEDPDIDLMVAGMVEGEPEHVRVAIVEKIRDMLREREQQKAKEIEQAQGQEKEKVKAQKRSFGQWLAWIMSEDTLRKIRESFLARPGLEGQLKDIGQELAKKGVLTQMEVVSRNDLGDLSQNVAQTKAAEKGKDQMMR
jgi:hypothetical protein